MPPDFEEMWPSLGWQAAQEHYRADWKCVRRWLDELGLDQMLKRRRGWRKAQQALEARERRKNYRYCPR